MICNKLMTEAVVIACCGKSFCKECTYIIIFSLLLLYFCILYVNIIYDCCLSSIQKSLFFIIKRNLKNNDNKLKKVFLLVFRKLFTLL